MTTKTNTGGLKSFITPKNFEPTPDLQLKKDIEKGHQEYYQRKKKEKIIKGIIGIAIIILITLVILWN